MTTRGSDGAELTPFAIRPLAPPASERLHGPGVGQAPDAQQVAPPRVAKPKRTTPRTPRTQAKRPAAPAHQAPKRSYSGIFAKEAAALADTHAAEYHGYAEVLRRIADYTWHDPNAVVRARTAFAAAASAVEAELPTAEATLSTIEDLFDYDRARHAAHIRMKGVKPIRLNDIPGVGVIFGTARRETFKNWGERVPFAPSETVVRILAEVMPDELVLVTYEHPDPIIYARYGNWYVKLAEWQ